MGRKPGSSIRFKKRGASLPGDAGSRWPSLLRVARLATSTSFGHLGDFWVMLRFHVGMARSAVFGFLFCF